MTPPEQAAAYLLAARDGSPAGPFPPAIRPVTEADATAIQRLTLASLGPIGGWKVGAPGPDGPINCAPLPAANLLTSPARLDPAQFTVREVEAEIAFRLAVDLPPRATPYDAADLVAAIADCVPAIEVLQPRFADPEAIDALSHQADLIRHGALVTGAPIPGWQSRDFARLAVHQSIEGSPERCATGNPAGDMMRLMVWLANTGAVWAGGLRAGTIVTCGSWTGRTPAPAGSRVSVVFEGIEAVIVTFQK